MTLISSGPVQQPSSKGDQIAQAVNGAEEARRERPREHISDEDRRKLDKIIDDWYSRGGAPDPKAAHQAEIDRAGEAMKDDIQKWNSGESPGSRPPSPEQQEGYRRRFLKEAERFLPPGIKLPDDR